MGIIVEACWEHVFFILMSFWSNFSSIRLPCGFFVRGPTLETLIPPFRTERMEGVREGTPNLPQDTAMHRPLSRPPPPPVQILLQVDRDRCADLFSRTIVLAREVRRILGTLFVANSPIFLAQNGKNYMFLSSSLTWDWKG